MKQDSDNPIAQKSFDFALRIVNLYKYLVKEKKETVLSKQLLRSGTSIGANVREALRGQSKADFRAKMAISLKECSETEYWIELLKASDYLTDDQFKSLQQDYKELIKMLMSIVKNSAA